MMVTTGAVDMAMGNFFVGRVTDFADGHVKVKIFSRERMVAVKGHFVVGEFGDGDNLRSPAAAGLELDSNLQIGHTFDLGSGDVDNFLGIMLAIAFRGRNIHPERIADHPAIKGFFQPGNNLTTAMDVGKGFVTLRGVNGLFLIVSERVVDEHDFAGSDFHGN